MNDKYTVEQVADIVEMEGLGYAIEGYLGAENIEDLELAARWHTAQEAMKRIREIIGDDDL